MALVFQHFSSLKCTYSIGKNVASPKYHQPSSDFTSSGTVFQADPKSPFCPVDNGWFFTTPFRRPVWGLCDPAEGDLKFKLRCLCCGIVSILFYLPHFPQCQFCMIYATERRKFLYLVCIRSQKRAKNAGFPSLVHYQ